MARVTILMLSLFLSATVFADNISLLFNERVPYLIYKNNKLTGLTGSPAVNAFDQADIPFSLKKVPSKRQIDMLKSNNGPYCLIGWFKNSNREQFAYFTKAIYQDKPAIALAKSGNAKIKSGMSIEQIMQDSSLKLLVKDGYSYGKFIDDKIATQKPTTTTTTSENDAMFTMISHGRADYMFTSIEEADGLIQALEMKKAEFKFITFSDMPKGNKRYILCSHQVGKDVVDKLNVHIK
ncbi:transporter substrate-binding domain-containing protein [Vibrio profundum]|uniref:hypothetical protein n=1 Tax=Vibrio profundum TaxID=2910247 RepID=UPI003D0AB631